MTSARAIIKSLGGMWCGSYGLARCPVHDDRKPSLKIKDDKTKRDGIDLICFAGCDWRDIKAELERQKLIEGVGQRRPSPTRCRPSPAQPSKPPLSPEERTQIALRIWSHSVPLKNTLGWRYFTERRQLHIGLLDVSHVLRWHAAEHAVIALMTDAVTGKPTGIHRTYLRPDATNDIDEHGNKKKKMLGPRGVIRLSADEDVTEGLGICEGIEDGLALLLSGWAPVWAASCAGAIETFPVLSGIEVLTIFADNDDVGMRAAALCADRWEAAGRDVTIKC
jgi:hypothetical protein